MGWFKNQYEEVRGNAKWDIIKWASKWASLVILAGIGASLRSWFFSLSRSVQIPGLVVVALVITNSIFVWLWLKARRRPIVNFPGPPPSFLFPRGQTGTIRKPHANCDLSPPLSAASSAAAIPLSAGGRTVTHRTPRELLV